MQVEGAFFPLSRACPALLARITHCPSSNDPQAAHRGIYPSLFSAFSFTLAPLCNRLFALRTSITLPSIAGYVLVFARTRKGRRERFSLGLGRLPFAGKPILEGQKHHGNV
jgi:hypothetical protein